MEANRTARQRHCKERRRVESQRLGSDSKATAEQREAENSREQKWSGKDRQWQVYEANRAVPYRQSVAKRSKGIEPQRHDQQWHSKEPQGHGKDLNGKGYEWPRIAAE